MRNSASDSRRRLWPDHQTVWRWHFYAGLLCIPFVLWLSATGSIYLFKPQIDRLLDRPYDRLTIDGPAASPEAQVRAALAAVPGSVLNAYELPRTAHSAARVLVGKGQQLVRVYVHPQTLAILHTVNEDRRFTRLLFHLHGELLQGDRGSMIVETAASWALVMLITGLYLWWPSGASSLAGVLYPRLRARGRVFWRDLHSVTGLWVTAFALFLLISGLPWAKFWGSMLKELRGWSSPTVVAQDWTTGRSSELAERRLQNAPAVSDEHAGHRMTAGAPGGASAIDYSPLNRILPTVRAAQLEAPVLIAPPSQAAANWTARSDTPNRPHRVTLQLDSASGAILKREPFGARPLLDRIIGIGVAAHEGQLFAPLNQLLGLCTALGLQVLSISAVVLWWRRRPEQRLGAPQPSSRRYAPVPLVLVIVLLAIALPLLGASLLFILALERWVLRRIATVARFLGLTAVSEM